MEGEDRSTRRSARSTRGVAPPRLGFEEERSMRSSRRSGGGQSRSSYETQRRVLEAEKRLLEKELELVRLAQDEASSSGQGAKGSSSPKMASEVFAEELIEGHEADAAVDAGQGDEASMGEVEVAHLPEHAVAVSHDPEPHAVPSPSVAGTVSAHTSRSLPVAVRTESEVARASTNTEQANLSGLRVQQEFVLKEKRYQRELSEAQSIADAEQRRVAKLNKDLASARADLSSLQAENRRVTQEKEVCEAERDVSERELRELQPHLERLEREHQEGRRCLEDLRDQNDRLLTRAEQVSAEQHAQRAELLDKLERLRAENASLQQRADRGGGRGSDEQRTQRAELLVQLDQLRGENDRLRRRADHDQYTAQCSSAQQQELRSRIQSDQEPEEIVKTHQAAGSTVKGLQQDGRGQADEGLQSQLSRLTARQAKINTDLPAFSGAAEEWPAFHHMFQSTTKQCGFTEAENIQRLRVCLKGPAKEAVRMLLNVPENLPKVLSTLERRFGRPELVVTELVSKAKSAKPVRSDDVETLVSYSTSVKNVVLCMKLLGSCGHMSNPTLRQELVNKLPVALKMQWGEYLAEKRIQMDSLDLEVFADWLENRAEAALNVAGPFAKAAPRASNATAMHTTGGPASTTKPVLQCAKCGKAHSLTSCDVFRQLSVKQRWDFVLGTSLCVCCFKTGHWKSECRGSGCNKCRGRHHPDLHQERAPPANQGSTSRSTKPRENVVPQHSTNTSVATTQKTAFMVVPVVLCHQDKTVRATAMMDSGSSTTYLKDSVANDLGLQGTPTAFTASVLGGKTVSGKHRRVKVTMASEDGSYETQLEAWTQPIVTAPMEMIEWNSRRHMHKHLQEVTFPQVTGDQVDLLIGLNVPEAHRVLEELAGQPGEPVARKLPLGWVCFGPVKSQAAEFTETSLHANVSDRSNAVLDDLVAKFWEVESVGLVPKATKTVAEEEAQRMVEGSMKLMDGRVSTAIPWVSTDKKPDLPPNREMAEQRLRNLERTLRKRPEVYQQYSDVIKSHIAKGYIHPCQETDQQWLLPHLAVVRADKTTTKVRVVFDAAARCQGKSLNDEMHSGPKLQRDLVHVLMKFCLEPIALVGDIAEMFLQVEIAPEDRKYLRFLWRDTPDEPAAMYEFSRLVFGLKASPYLACRALKATSAEHGASFSKLAREAVDEAFYVDDLLDSLPTVESAINTRQEVQSLLGKASFHVRKWRSNSQAVLESIPDEDLAKEALLCISNDSQQIPAVVKTLGVVWDAKTDTFSYTHRAPEEQQWTKRQVLSKMASIFDPRGHIVPFTMRARLMFQELCAAGIGWDDQIPAELNEKWYRWFAELEHLSKIKIQRCLKETDRPAHEASLSVHVFTDASAHATAAVGYVRAEYPDGHVRISIALARARATPLKKVTIPKLELRGAVLGVQVSAAISEALHIPMSEHNFWTDSMNVVHWVRSPAKNFTSDVANRIAAIQESTKPTQWRHVPGKINPADLPTRGVKAEDLPGNECWWQGPAFLRNTKESWPQTELTNKPQLPGQVKKTIELAFTAVEPDKGRLDVERYSRWTRLIRVTSWCWRFVSNAKLTADARVMRGHSQDASSAPTEVVCANAPGAKANPSARRHKIVKVPELIAAEIEHAERFWIAQGQQEAYPESCRILMAGRELPPSDPLYKLSPGVDTSAKPPVLVLCGRLKYAEHLPASMRRPMVLPSKHPVTQLIVRHQDEKCGHVAGSHQLLSILRERFWIVHGLSVVKAMKRACLKCQRIVAKPAQQLMGPLPSYRTLGTKQPFSQCGVDYAGPFYTSQGRGRAQQKRYLCVFTCLETRACHLEMSFGLDTESFLMSFSRFTKRRGVPSLMLSDNGTNFVAAERELREAVEALDRAKICRDGVHRGIQWRFNPPRAPHHGGVFESMVKCAKKALVLVLSRANLRDEELMTAIVEAESLLNSRPLTAISDDPSDMTPLTPNHFIVGRLDLPLALEEAACREKNVHPRRRWMALQLQVDHVWRRWQKELVVTYNMRKKWLQQKPNLKADDLVLVMEDGISRGHWPLGRVVGVHPGQDGLVRVVDVRLSNKKVKRRAIQRLVPLTADGE
ncbi:uncharacterized protein LOC135813418 [Sycon ciliatum]|uniref:uncharacterized protein LOC135813418 n=1 Tax=Sycon ciliatum TaxID=27933 RepID=UPI0031F6AA58